jgi:Txe/YoeB family toxin of Txe-Axe toxin-antitoxin module
MSYHGKEVDVVLTGEAKDFFERLKATIEKDSAKTRHFQKTLFRSINEEITLLREDPSYGIQVPKNLIPEEYILAYDADNLWKVNLSGYWRTIYTVNGKEVKVIAVVIDIFDHRDYNKKFKYRKRKF